MDTDPATRRDQAARWRDMTPSERVAVADRLSVDLTRLAIVGIRSQHPNATDEEVTYELARRRYGDEIADLLRPGSTRP